VIFQLKTFQKYSSILWGLATGVLFATSYPPFPAWALFFAFAPLWVYWYRSKSLKNVLVSGFVAQFTMTLIGFNWVAHTAREYGHLPSLISFLILIGFCSFAVLSVVIAGVIIFFVNKRWPMGPTAFFLFAAVASGFSDWIYPTIFPWNTGYPLLFSNFHSAQLAEIFGFNLLGTLVYLANSAFAHSFIKFPKPGWSRPLIYFVLGMFIFETWGTHIEKSLPKEDQTLDVLMVQPNIGNYDKFYAERGNGYQEPVVIKDLSLTENALVKLKTKPQVIIWPETAYPASLDSYFSYTHYFKVLQDFTRKYEVPILTGSYSDDSARTPNPKSYNAVFLMEPQGTLQPGYRKHILLAFGEYFPGAEYIPFLKKIVPEISDFGRGPGPTIFNLESGARLTPLICYEGLDTGYVQKSIALDGNILVNVTNDSWFGNNFEPVQHLIMTVARTVEYRRPMIRVTNTGYTVVSDVRGKILMKGPQNTEWAQNFSVPFRSDAKKTIFYHIEKFVTLIFLALAVGLVFLRKFFRE
jgi:apolipoprotein N-acyltransferase